MDDQTQSEHDLIKEIGFDEHIVPAIKTHTKQKLRRATNYSEMGEQSPASGLSIEVSDSDSAEQGAGVQREKDHPEKFAAALALCPEVPSSIIKREQGAERTDSGDARRSKIPAIARLCKGTWPPVNHNGSSVTRVRN